MRHLMQHGPANMDFEYTRTLLSTDALGYDLECVKKLMLPVPYLGSWALYVFDTGRKHLLVMDPTMTSAGIEAMRAKHEDNAKLVLWSLVRCIHENVLDWEISSGNWTFEYNSAMHMS